MAPSQSLLLLPAMAVCTASLASGTRPFVLWRSSRLPTAARMQESGAQEVLLEGSELTQTFDGEQYQFRGVDVLLPRGSKQGLVGVNGVGKSSLLRVLAGVDAPESGDVTVSCNARVAYVEQEPTLPAGSTAADFVYRADAPVYTPALPGRDPAGKMLGRARDYMRRLVDRLCQHRALGDRYSLGHRRGLPDRQYHRHGCRFRRNGG